MATTAEELNVKITAKFEELNSALGQARASVDQFSEHAAQAGSKLSGVGAQAEAGFARVSSSAERSGSVLSSIMSNWVVQVLAVGAAYKAVAGTIAQFTAGLDFNSVIEQSRLGIASLITAEASLSDAAGKTLQGQDALNAALAISDGQMQKLRIAGLQTAATTQQLAESFQQAIGAGLGAGLGLDQIRQLTVQITQAAGALGVPMNQLNQEVVSILAGTIDMNSRVAKALGLSNAMVASWKEQGTLFAQLNDRMKAFTVAGAEISKTWAATKSNVAEARDAFMGLATSGYLEKVKTALNEALSGVFNMDTASISSEFDGLLKAMTAAFTSLGETVGDAIRGIVADLKQMSAWLDTNGESLKAVFASIGASANATAGHIGELMNAIGRLLPGTKQLADNTDKIRIAMAALEGLITYRVIAAIGAWITSLGAADVAAGAATAALGGPIGAIIKITALLFGASQAWDSYNKASTAVANAPKPGELPMGVGTASRAKFAPTFAAAEEKYNLPRGLLMGIGDVESGGSFKTSLTSPAGAQGLMQFMPGTAKQYGLENPFDAQASIDAAGRYMSDMAKKFPDDIRKAIAAYNTGPGNVEAAVRKYGAEWEKHLATETQKYIPEVMRRGGMAAGGVTFTPNKAEPTDRESAAAKKLLDEKLRLHEQELAQETEKELNAIEVRRAALEASHKTGETGAADYYKAIAALDDEATAASIAGLQKKRAVYAQQLAAEKAGTADYLKLQGEVGRIDAQIADASSKGAVKRIGDAASIAKAERDLQKEIDATRAKLEAMSSGDTMSGIAAGIAEKHSKEIERFAAAGSTEGVDLTQRLINAETVKAQLKEIETEFNATLARMQAEETSYNTQSEAGLMTQWDLRTSINSLHQKTADELDALASAYEKLKATATDASKTEMAAAGATFDTMRAKVVQTRQTASTEAKAVENVMETSFVSAFDSIVSGSATATQAMSGFFRSVLSGIANLAAQSIAKSIFGGITGSSGSGSSGLGSLVSGITGLFGSSSAISTGTGQIMSSATSEGLALSSGSGSIALFQSGGNVDNTGLAMLHKNEMVLPANIAQSVRGMAAGGGTTKTVTQSTVNHNIQLSQGALNMTMSDWLQRELSGVYANR